MPTFSKARSGGGPFRQTINKMQDSYTPGAKKKKISYEQAWDNMELPAQAKLGSFENFKKKAISYNNKK